MAESLAPYEIDNSSDKYPDCFPPNIEELIIEDGAAENEFEYYRISRTGMINRDEFLSTKEEQLKDKAGFQNRDMYVSDNSQINIGKYSTSGYEKMKDAERRLNCMKRYENAPIIMVGKTVPSCGLSLRTKESRTRKCRDSHIDWWIYKDARPEIFFRKVDEDNGSENA